MKPTRRTIDEFLARLTKGTRVECLENTLFESRGLTRGSRPLHVAGVVTRPGKTSIRIRTDAGAPFLLQPPRRVGDVLELTGRTITYRLGIDDHTATWRIAD